MTKIHKISSTVNKVGIVVLVIWLITLFYLWLPNIVDSKKWPFLGKKGLNSINMNSKANSTNMMHIVITSDKHTLGGMIATMNSIYSNTRHDVMFHLVVDDESFDHIIIWLKKTKLHMLNYEVKRFPLEWVQDKIHLRSGRPELGRPLNYARYYLPRLFPDLKGRILFIDDDCIVQGDISDLYNMKINSGDLAAFSNDCSATSKRLSRLKNNYAEYIDFKNKHIQQMHMHPATCSFNTGLMLTDLDLWKKNNITEQLEYWLQLNKKEEVYGNEKGGGGSQPPMMIVFYKNYTAIDPSWHVRYLGWTSGTSYSKAFVSHAKMLHWNGHFKPWGRLSQHSDIWDRYFVKDPTLKFKPLRRFST